MQREAEDGMREPECGSTGAGCRPGLGGEGDGGAGVRERFLLLSRFWSSPSPRMLGAGICVSQVLIRTLCIF